MPPNLESRRARIRALEPPAALDAARLPFGIAAHDQCLPGGGLTLGALHEIFSADRLMGAVSLFAAGILARIGGPVLWCLAQPDLFAPGLDQAGLAAARLIHLQGVDETMRLACCEEALRHGGVSVVAEIGPLSLTASRRLQLAAERAGRPLLALRLPRREEAVSAPSAAGTRWRITPLPSAPLPVPGIGRARWRVELLRCRGGRQADVMVEACDGQGYLAVPAAMAGGAADAADGLRRAAG